MRSAFFSACHHGLHPLTAPTCRFMTYVEKTIASRPAEAALGGVPSVQNKIRGFLNVKYQKNGQWSNQALEVGLGLCRRLDYPTDSATPQIANNTPVWARIYYLLRSGHAKEALAFATENEAALQKLEKSFVPYFKAWLDSPDRRLPKLLRDRFLSEYNQRIRYLTDTSDPYKHALYKLIGRVEINRRNVPGVTQTTEDWLWFQLSLVRETEGQGEAPHEKYGLRDLAAVLLKFGEAHFDPKGTRPLLYFQVLLLSGQFERVGLLCFRAVCFLTVADFSTSTQAIAFLLQHSQYQADAVHFAIALAYYGLLRVPARGHAADVEFRESSGRSFRLTILLTTTCSHGRQDRDPVDLVRAPPAPLHSPVCPVRRRRSAPVPVPDLPQRRPACAARRRASRARAPVRARTRHGDEAVQSAAGRRPERRNQGGESAVLAPECRPAC